MARSARIDLPGAPQHLVIRGNNRGASGMAPGSLSRLVQSVGRRYSRYANRVQGRTGTLFEGRFHSSLIECERYLFTCMRYIELNPVRAGIVADPADYPWSSHRENAGLGRRLTWLVPRAEYFALGSHARARADAYRSLFSVPIDGSELEAIRSGANKGCAIGSVAFLERMERELGRSVVRASPGRPPRREM